MDFVKAAIAAQLHGMIISMKERIVLCEKRLQRQIDLYEELDKYASGLTDDSFRAMIERFKRENPKRAEVYVPWIEDVYTGYQAHLLYKEATLLTIGEYRAKIALLEKEIGALS